MAQDFYALVGKFNSLCVDEGGEPFICRKKNDRNLTSFLKNYPDAKIKKVKIEILNYDNNVEEVGA